VPASSRRTSKASTTRSGPNSRIQDADFIGLSDGDAADDDTCYAQCQQFLATWRVRTPPPTGWRRAGAIRNPAYRCPVTL